MQCISEHELYPLGTLQTVPMQAGMGLCLISGNSGHQVVLQTPSLAGAHPLVPTFFLEKVREHLCPLLSVYR